MRMKKKTNMFSINALTIPSELRFAQSQYHIMKPAMNNISRPTTVKRLTGEAPSLHFAIPMSIFSSMSSHLGENLKKLLKIGVKST